MAPLRHHHNHYLSSTTDWLCDKYKYEYNVECVKSKFLEVINHFHQVSYIHEGILFILALYQSVIHDD